MPPVSQSRSRVITCRGARAAERCLLEQLAAVRATVPEELSLPVRVVVPSKSLRQHLLRVMVRERGALAGVLVQTLQAAALEVLDRAGLAAPRGDAGFELLVRRLARSERALRAPLEALEDGYGAVLGPVRDLLDAGFEPALEEGVLERIDELAGAVAKPRLARARALVRLAAASHRALDEHGLWRSADALRRAEEALAADPGLLPARAVVVHGFADVTGLASDLLRAVVRAAPSVVVVDRPPDPAEAGCEDAGTVFLDRFLQSVAHLAGTGSDAVVEQPELTLAEAPDPESELRWVAERVRELIDSGCEPESVGVVARGLESLGPVIRRHFRRLGIPCSGSGAAVPGPSRRRHRLAEVLVRGAGSEVDRWTEAWGDGGGRTELLLGLRTLGVLRVGDAAALAPARDLRTGVRLPLALGEDDGEGSGSSARVLPASALERVAARARAFVGALAEWPVSAPAAAHRERSAAVLSALGWRQESEDWREVEACLAGLEGELEPGLQLERAEWLRLLGERLRSSSQVPIGGAGGGVQVLTVMEARARTFEHLFVVALNRGIFPRLPAEDALLPEALRARLASDVLPHMPLRARSADEERFLFAQLLSAAPEVRLSWHLAAGESKLAASPFVDRLRLCRGAPPVLRVPGVWDPEAGSGRLRPAWEHAVLAAVRGRGAGIEPLIATALAEGGTESGEPAAELAAARGAVLAAVEAPPAAGPGPWSGFVGGGVGASEEQSWVTHLEAFATCPWRSFVNRALGVQPLADPHLDLPDPGGRLVGLVVHEVLEAVVLEALGETPEGLDGAMARSPVEVRWPEAARFEELLRAASQRVARAEGLAALGLGLLLAARARPFLEVARRLEWGKDGRLAGILASEVVGSASLPEAPRPLAFRADRVGRGPDGTLLVDYKTGAPWTQVKSPDLQRRDVLLRVARGRALQAVAYALAPTDGGAGRYLFLKPVIAGDESTRTVTIGCDDAEAVGHFTAAVGAVTEARGLGVVFPRVEEADNDTEPAHCRSCAVKECCLRDDSRFRQRLVALMAPAAGDDADPARAAARRLWWLGVGREEEP